MSKRGPYRHPWLFRARATSLLILASVCYVGLSVAVPYLLRDIHELVPLARLGPAAAPLAALLVLIPLPGALWRAWRERRLVSRLRDIDALRAMNWHDLEILMRRMFETQGYRAERVGGAGADGGVDIILRRGQLVILVQCKQWKSRQVSVSVVRELMGVMALEGADGGIVVTCGVFTKDAQAFAERANITLIDGMAVLKLAEGEQLVPATVAGRERPEVLAEDVKACPVCGGQMVRRIAKSGRNSGTKFLGCANFPTCNGTRPLQPSII